METKTSEDDFEFWLRFVLRLMKVTSRKKKPEVIAEPSVCHYRLLDFPSDSYGTVMTVTTDAGCSFTLGEGQDAGPYDGTRELYWQAHVEVINKTAPEKSLLGSPCSTLSLGPERLTRSRSCTTKNTNCSARWADARRVCTVQRTPYSDLVEKCWVLESLRIGNLRLEKTHAFLSDLNLPYGSADKQLNEKRFTLDEKAELEIRALHKALRTVLAHPIAQPDFIRRIGSLEL